MTGSGIESADGTGWLSRFADLRAAAFSVAGIVVLVALVVLVLASLLHEGSVRRVIESVAAIVFAIGLVQILSDTYLHARLSNEILGRVDKAVAEIGAEVSARLEDLEGALQLDRALRPTGLERFTRATVDWAEFLDGASRIALVPWDLSAWEQQEWRAILELARTRRLEVDLYLPNAESPYASALEVRFERTQDQLRDRLQEIVRNVRIGWQNEARIAGSTLRLHTYDQPAGLGFLLANDRWALVAPPILGPRPATTPLVALARDASDPGYREWLGDQLSALKAQPFDEVDIS